MCRPGRTDRSSLCVAVPRVTSRQAGQLVAALSTVKHPRSELLLTESIVARALQWVGLGGGVPPGVVIKAISLPAQGRVEPWEVADLLLGLLGGRSD